MMAFAGVFTTEQQLCIRTAQTQNLDEASFYILYKIIAEQPSLTRYKRPMYRKGTSIRQASFFRHLRALRKKPWKFIIWMNEL